MKKVLIVGIVAALVIGALAAPALADIRLKGGWFMPSEKVTGEYEGSFPADGLFFGAEMTTMLPGGIIGIGVGAEYFQSNQALEQAPLPAESLDVSTRIIPVTATAYIYPSAGLYVGGGIGYYLVNVTFEGEPQDKSGIGYHAVAGYQITDRIFLEGKYSTCTISDWWWPGWNVGGISIAAGVSL